MNQHQAKNKFKEFVRNFRRENLYPYRDQLLARWRKQENFLEVDLGDLSLYDHELHSIISNQPTTYLPLFEDGIKDVLKQLVATGKLLTQSHQIKLTDLICCKFSTGRHDDEFPNMQIILRSEQDPIAMRDITADQVNKLVKVWSALFWCPVIC